MTQGLCCRILCQLRKGEIFNPENLWKLMQLRRREAGGFQGYLDTFRGSYDNKDFRWAGFRITCYVWQTWLPPSKSIKGDGNEDECKSFYRLSHWFPTCIISLLLLCFVMMMIAMINDDDYDDCEDDDDDDDDDDDGGSDAGWSTVGLNACAVLCDRSGRW